MRVHVNVQSSAIVHHLAVVERAGYNSPVWSGHRPAGNFINLIFVQRNGPMSLSAQQHIYRSANEDLWLLMTDTASGRKFVTKPINHPEVR